MKRVLIAIFAFFAIAVSAKAQVGMFPQAIFLDQANRTATMTLINSSEQTKEVSIDINFGYPAYDSNGVNYMNYKDTVKEKIFSIVPYVRVFPKKIVLKGKEEQVVKFVLGNVSDLSDGFYFSRVTVLSQDPKKEIDTTYKPDKIEAKFDIRFAIVGAVFFKKGNPDCKIRIDGGDVVNDTTGMRLRVDYVREGGAPFFGTTIIRAYDMQGNQIDEFGEISPVYFNCKKTFKLKEEKYTPGQMYNFQIIMTNEHKDIPDSFRIPFEPYVNTVSAMVKSKI